jgi:hypothetical protein
MGKMIIVTVFVVTLFGSIASASAAGLTGCDEGTLTEVGTLAALPREIGIMLGTSRTGLDGIADIGEKFNATDAIGDASLPMRRLALAATGVGCVYVAVERGGRGYSIELWVFQWSGDGWRGEQLRKMRPSFQRPRSLPELVAQVNMP